MKVFCQTVAQTGIKIEASKTKDHINNSKTQHKIWKLPE